MIRVAYTRNGKQLHAMEIRPEERDMSDWVALFHSRLFQIVGRGALLVGVTPHVKGPPDAPFKETKRAWEFTR